MDIKSFQVNLDLAKFKFDEYADIAKQNEDISKKRAEIYGTDRNFNKISENESENYIAIKNNEPITYKKYKDYVIYSDNKDLLYYEGSHAHYVITKDTDTNFISKLSLVDKMFLLNKNDTTDEKIVVKDDKYFMQKMIDDMIIEQTSFMLDKKLDPNYDVWYFFGAGRNHSYANKFTPDAEHYEIKNYSNPNQAIPNSYYLNSYANSNLINTKFGKAELFLDLAGDNDKLGVGSFNSNSQLFRFDSDGNGFVDKNDDYFDKLKVRAYDENGNEIIKKLSEVVDSINLKDFIDSKSNALNKWKKDVSGNGWDEKTYKQQFDMINSYNPYSNFKAEIRYESMNNNDIKELSKLADKDGWIDASDLQGLANLAYAKKGFNGNYKLEELNYSNDKVGSYNQYSKFNSLYEDYMAEINALNGFFDSYKQSASSEILAEFVDIIKNPSLKSTLMLNLEKEFTNLTGLKFTLANLEKVKNSFESDRSLAANMLKDTDALSAIRINKNGTFTLRFNSGREINVDKLYKDSGKAFDIELNINADFMSEDELNQSLDLSVSMANIKDKLTGEVQTKSLKELGVKIINKLLNGKFALHTNDGKSIIVDQIYTKIDQNQDTKENSGLNKEDDKLNRQNNELNLINDKVRFYPKPLRVWA
ncbi:hypothetical protein CIG1485E_0159 [Campylobacter iguaniorum]|uniref:Uncharacterized protein n=1 Tax=Campylobacter iguaniorum TaxID=1244531 RepID=A0A076F6V2_9BACT|nr:hypothetical protein [Campylobacter iguaniorum]AII14035.1 hypothetical protein CIG1485E_0159 [Campylobacter iguaniorum]